MPALAAVNDAGGVRSARTPSPEMKAYQSQARWAKPMPRAHKNFIPASSWLGYNWIDKDPELEFVLHAIEESGWTLEKIERETEAHGHKVSRYTLLAWFYKGTKRPQNATMNTVMAVIGWERPWVRIA
jgi:hypothetical protein